MAKTYKIVRVYKDYEDVVMQTGKTRAECVKHVSNPETSWRTCTKPENKAHTEEMGQWFDGYEAE